MILLLLLLFFDRGESFWGTKLYTYVACGDMCTNRHRTSPTQLPLGFGYPVQNLGKGTLRNPVFIVFLWLCCEFSCNKFTKVWMWAAALCTGEFAEQFLSTFYSICFHSMWLQPWGTKLLPADKVPHKQVDKGRKHMAKLVYFVKCKCHLKSSF